VTTISGSDFLARVSGEIAASFALFRISASPYSTRRRSRL
jgi:hypothetical protein